MPESREQRRRPPPPTEPQSRTKRIWAFFQTVLPTWWARGAAIVSALLAMVWGTAKLYSSVHDIYTTTIPGFQQSTAPGGPDSYLLPFILKNRSSYFDMSNLDLFCEYANVTWSVATREHPNAAIRVRITDGGAIRRQATEKGLSLRQNEALNLSCSADDAIKAARLDGQPMPMTLVKARIKVDYRTDLWLFSVPRTYTSQIFTWKKTESGYQWYEGDLIR